MEAKHVTSYCVHGISVPLGSFQRRTDSIGLLPVFGTFALLMNQLCINEDAMTSLKLVSTEVNSIPGRQP